MDTGVCAKAEAPGHEYRHQHGNKIGASRFYDKSARAWTLSVQIVHEYPIPV